MATTWLVAGVLAAASLPVIAPAPSYDPWAWLLWGREVTELRLSTPEGPAFKPLPVAVCAVLAPLGAAAPWLWVLIARAAAVAAVLLAFGLGRRLAGGSLVAGILAATAVVVTEGFAAHAAAGVAEGMLLGLALTGLELLRRGHPSAALACGGACALLRVETWPLLAVAAVIAWRRLPRLRGFLAAAALLVPAAWFVPELLGSGDLLRSGERARIPNPGQPALAPVPALASLSGALALVPWPAWGGLAGVALLRLADGRPARGASQRRRLPAAALADPLFPAALGMAWIAIVAAMAQAGFSGEARYAMPGAALIAISGGSGLAAGLVALARWATGRQPAGRRRSAMSTAAVAGLAVAGVAALAGPRAAGLAGIPAAQAHQWRLAQDLRDAVARVGGRERVLACGTPYVGGLRGPLMAYALDVAKERVEPDAAPAAPGVVFRSPLTERSRPGPDAPAAFHRVARAGDWEVLRSCGAEG